MYLHSYCGCMIGEIKSVQKEQFMHGSVPNKKRFYSQFKKGAFSRIVAKANYFISHNAATTRMKRMSLAGCDYNNCGVTSFLNGNILVFNFKTMVVGAK